MLQLNLNQHASNLSEIKSTCFKSKGYSYIHNSCKHRHENKYSKSHKKKTTRAKDGKMTKLQMADRPSFARNSFHNSVSTIEQGKT